MACTPVSVRPAAWTSHRPRRRRRATARSSEPPAPSWLVGLGLEAAVGAAVIFQQEPVAGHQLSCVRPDRDRRSAQGKLPRRPAAPCASRCTRTPQAHRALAAAPISSRSSSTWPAAPLGVLEGRQQRFLDPHRTPCRSAAGIQAPGKGESPRILRSICRLRWLGPVELRLLGPDLLGVGGDAVLALGAFSMAVRSLRSAARVAASSSAPIAAMRSFTVPAVSSGPIRRPGPTASTGPRPGSLRSGASPRRRSADRRPSPPGWSRRGRHMPPRQQRAVQVEGPQQGRVDHLAGPGSGRRPPRTAASSLPAPRRRRSSPGSRIETGGRSTISPESSAKACTGEGCRVWPRPRGAGGWE